MPSKIQKLVLISLIAFSGFAVNVNIANAETSGWVTPREIKALSYKMKKEKLMPLTMECRGDSRSFSVRDSMEIRMTYGANSSNKHWRWAWGQNFGLLKKLSEKRGFKQVSTSSFTRPKTGLVVHCGVFHKAR